MKVFCMVLCLAVAAMAGFLAYAAGSGRLSLRPPAAEGAAVATGDARPIIHGQVGLVDELVKSLKAAQAEFDDRTLRLDKREKDLQEREAAYRSLQQETGKLLDELDSRLVKVKQTEFKNSKQLSEVYSKMDPAAAARAFRSMESSQVALVLSQMDGRAMAAILDAAVTTSSDGSKSVAEWSDAIRRLTDEKVGP